ncbi:MAG: SDR family oxidoreductase [Cyanobacteria bacterium J069]|nr:MAG: SDR family NAD(P)-dependent oxidoreductase [Cyanobacteria bacterium J069]
MITPQHAMITGGSSGIGLAIARRLAAQGTSLSLIARTPEKLAAAQLQIESKRQSPSQQVLTFAADVADREQAEPAVQEAIAQLGPPDLLVTCAGIARPGEFLEIPTEVFERTMAVNYFGTLYCIRAALPAMEQRRRGQIVCVSSGAGLVGLYGYTAYSPSKFALRGLAEALRGELKPKGIGVSIVYPPDTDTPQLVEENKTKPLVTQKITATAKTWSADGVAEVILAGVQRHAFAITPGFEMGALNRLHSVLLPLLSQYFDQITTKVINPR